MTATTRPGRPFAAAADSSSPGGGAVSRRRASRIPSAALMEVLL